MLLITCPWCGPRDEIEFTCGGEAHRARPADPAATDDAAFADFLFMRTNPKGLQRERWCHSQGCRRWFNLERSTITHEITRVYKMGEQPETAPALETAPAPRQPARQGGRS